MNNDLNSSNDHATYYDSYQISLAKHTIDTLNSQLYAGQIILCFVIFITIVGVFLAALQLYWSKNFLDKISCSVGEVTPKSIKLSSPFVGLFILLISLGIFIFTLRISIQSKSSSRTLHTPNQAQPPGLVQHDRRKLLPKSHDSLAHKIGHGLVPAFSTLPRAV